MKLALVTTALAAAFVLSPALAPASAQQAKPNQGSVSVEGVKPSKALDAIDTSKLTDDAQQAASGAPSPSISYTTVEPAPVQKTTVDLPSLSVPLPQEVATLASRGNGKYSTKDLVKAELTAMNNAPPMQQPVITTTTITYPSGQ